MKRETSIAIFLVVSTAISGAIASTFVQERKTKKVTRVKRPEFSEKDWDGIYFENLFDEGLVGDRPAKATILKGTDTATQIAPPSDGGPSTQFAWSKFASGSVIEDEVKSQQAALNQFVTTPVKFKSEYGKVHQTFAVLSMMFAVIREYDGEVRWKRFAPDAQASFEKAAANSRVGTSQAYEYSKSRKSDLAEMVRGGNFESSEKAPEDLDWSAVIDRIPIMKRLQTSKDALKQMSSNKGEFEKSVDQVLHESEIVALMSQALMRESMTDADDEGYLAFAKSMNDAAIETRDAALNQDYETAAKTINLIDQSCNNCHDEWR